MHTYADTQTHTLQSVHILPKLAEIEVTVHAISTQKIQGKHIKY